MSGYLLNSYIIVITSGDYYLSFSCVAARERSRQLHDVILIRKGQQRRLFSRYFQEFPESAITEYKSRSRSATHPLSSPNPKRYRRGKYHVSPIIECFFFFLRNSLKSKVESILGQNPESRYFPGAKGCWGHVL